VAGAKIWGVTLKERLHKLVEKDHSSITAARGSANGAVTGEPAEMASAPASWGWDKTAWGEPMPNVVAWLQQSRQGR
jgi:hypothetical protein